jgi:hypothetical protein
MLLAMILLLCPLPQIEGTAKVVEIRKFRPPFFPFRTPAVRADAQSCDRC